MRKNAFSIVIPVYNEAKNIKPLYSQLEALVKKLKNSNLEFIFIDDGSTDDSLNELMRHKPSGWKVKIIKFSRNFGSWSAIIAGIDNSSGDCVGVISADLQESPELFIKMFSLWEKGKKTVLAIRKNRKDPFIDKALSALYYWLIRTFALPKMPQGGFDCMILDREVINKIRKYPDKKYSLRELVIWLDIKRANIYYQRSNRKFGSSKWTFGKKIKLMINSFAEFGKEPVRSLCRPFADQSSFSRYTIEKIF